MTDIDDRLPADAGLRGLVLRAQAELAAADPLGAALLSGDQASLPDGSLEAEAAETLRLEGLAAELEAIAGLAGDDELDREALMHSIRRSLPPAGPRRPSGSVILERQLLVTLVGLGLAPEPRAERLAAMVEAGPAFLEASRQGCAGGSAAAGEVALWAAKRMPLLLDLTAAAAKSLPLAPALRQRLEAGLGSLLAATAEDGGWILKEYMPQADPAGPRLVVEPSGLGMTLEQVEAQAEAMLADEAGLTFDAAQSDAQSDPPVDSPGPPAFPPGTAPRERSGLAVVADACRRAAAGCDPWCPEPSGVDFVVEAQPSWLQPLLPPLSLAPGGALAADPLRLLVGDGAAGLTVPELDRELAFVHAAEYLPMSSHRAVGRLARLLLPAPESLEGWRALALFGAPGVARRSRRELGWRAILALVALAMGRGRLDIDEAAELVAAETGMDAETARLQAVHVAAQPAAALTFIAGATAVGGAVARLGRERGELDARAAVLAAGPLPGISIDRLGYTS